jgi:hypothetical protein
MATATKERLTPRLQGHAGRVQKAAEAQGFTLLRIGREKFMLLGKTGVDGVEFRFTPNDGDDLVKISQYLSLDPNGQNPSQEESQEEIETRKILPIFNGNMISPRLTALGTLESARLMLNATGDSGLARQVALIQQDLINRPHFADEQVL